MPLPTVQDVLDTLNKIEDKTLPLFIVASSSGAAYTPGSAHVTEKRSYDDTGELCDLDDGTRYCRLSAS